MAERLINARDGSVVADSITWARTPWARVRGLIGRSPLRSGEALVITPASQVHTFGMSGPIDVLFCDRQWVVRHVVAPMVRRRVSRWVNGSRFVVEMAEGSLAGVAVGDHIILESQDPKVL